MKRTTYTLVIISVLSVLLGCSDDINGTKRNISTYDLTFKSTADFYDVKIDGNEAWNVVSCPEWATPTADAGTHDTAISLYIEDNLDEMERLGEMIVQTRNNEYRYYLTQRSEFTDDENSAIVSEKVLLKTNAVGYGIDVFKTGNKYALGRAAINPIKLIKTLEAIGESDAYSLEEQFYSDTESIIGTSTTAISTQLSVNAGIEADICGFKGSINGKFSSKDSTNEEKAYAIREIKHITSSRYLRPGILRFLAENQADSIFSSSFRKDMKAIQADPSNVNVIEDLVDTYGTHLVVYGTLGGELELALEMTSTEKLSEMDIHAALNLTHEMVNGDASFDMSESQKEIAKNTKISLKTYGGKNVYTMAPGTTFETAMKLINDTIKLNEWVKEIKDGSSLAVVDIQTYPIYDLMPDEASKNAVREYIVNTYQKEMLGHGALTFVVNGFNDKNSIWGYLNIPEINVRLEYHRENIPEISTTELSTIIYSGTIDKVNYDCGFFIGSTEKRPGKLRRNRGGKYSFEEFENLDYAALDKLYVDATGTVTIASKSQGNYSTCQFTPIAEDFPSTWTYGTKHEQDRTSFIVTSNDIEEFVQYPYEMAINFPGYNKDWSYSYNGKPIHVDNMEILFLKEKGNMQSILGKTTIEQYYFNQVAFTPPSGTRYIQINMDFYKQNAYHDDYTDYMYSLFEFVEDLIELHYTNTESNTPRWK